MSLAGAATRGPAGIMRRTLMASTHLRKVRSFVRRPGRITKAQQRALTTLLPRWGVPYRESTIDLEVIFGRRAPRVLDIGFGDGEALLTTAANNASIDYLGVEVHEPGIGHLLVLIEKAGLDNIRIIGRDVVDVIDRMIEDRAFDAVNLFFPDPWPKKRHHKRRLVQPGFVEAVARVLVDGGLFHIATDWTNHADHTREVLAQFADFTAVAAENLGDDPLAFRPPTKFERRGLRLDHVIDDQYYRFRPEVRNAEDRHVSADGSVVPVDSMPLGANRKDTNNS